MSNRYRLPEDKVDAVRERDTRCVYCHKEMHKPSASVARASWATIEHFNHLPPWNNPDTIGICCFSCNASRGNKLILDWFRTAYCKERDISPSTVAVPVLEYISRHEGYEESQQV
jgi:hypothetical protein